LKLANYAAIKAPGVLRDASGAPTGSSRAAPPRLRSPPDRPPAHAASAQMAIVFALRAIKLF
jgi:hypothetical protein